MIPKTIAAILLMFCTPVVAQLANPNFDVDISGWPSFEPENVQWSNDDADDSPSSGSLEGQDPNPGNNGVRRLVDQCVNLDSVEFPLEFTASAKVISEGEPGVRAIVFLREGNSPDCSNYVGFDRSFTINDGTESWQAFTHEFTPEGPDTRSVAVRLGIRKGDGSGTGGKVRYDKVFLDRGDPLFQDRFQGPDGN